MSFQAAAIALAWLAIIILAFAMAGILRGMRFLIEGRVPQPLDSGPPLGSSVPNFVADLAGAEATRAVLMFADTYCDACERILPEFAELAEANEDIRFIVLFRGSANGFANPRVAIRDGQADTFDRLRVTFTPFLVGVDSNGTVVDSAPGGSPERLQVFVGRLRGKEKTT